MFLKRFGFAELALPVMGLMVAAMAPLACSGGSKPAPKAAPAAADGKPLEPCAKPQPLKLGLTASARLNPGEKGESLATVVRVYQLKSIAKLTGASFDDLLDHDKDALGEDFLAMQEQTVNPGEGVEAPIPRNPETNYLLAVALFRRPAGTTWKVVRKLPPPDLYHCHASSDRRPTNDGTVRFHLDENRIELR